MNCRLLVDKYVCMPQEVLEAEVVKKRRELETAEAVLFNRRNKTWEAKQ